MRRPLRVLLAVNLPMFLLGVGRLIHYHGKLVDVSDGLRVVDFIGLSTAGALCGATFVGIMLAIRHWKPESPTIADKSARNCCRNWAVAWVLFCPKVFGGSASPMTDSTLDLGKRATTGRRVID